MCEELEIRNAVLISQANLETAFLVNRAFESVRRHLLHKLEAGLRRQLLINNYQIESNDRFFDGNTGCDFGILFSDQQDVRLVLGFDSNNFGDFYFGMAGRDEL